MVKERLYDGVKKISEFEHSSLKAAINSDAVIAAATTESSNLRIPAKDIDELATEKANSASAVVKDELQTQIDAKAAQTELNAEVQRALGAESALQTQINAKAEQSALLSEIKAREDADVVINSRIDGIEGTDVVALSNKVDAHIEDDNRHITEALLGHIDSKADQSELDSLEKGIDAIKDNLVTYVVTDVATINEEDSLKIKATALNLATGYKKFIVNSVPNANSQISGAMDPTAFKALQGAQQDIVNLKSKLEGLPRTAVVAGLGSSPTQAELTAAFEDAMEDQPRANDRIVNVDSNTEFIFDTEDVWQPLAGSTLGLATETNPGYVQHSEEEGKVGYPIEGVGHVNGYSSLKAQVLQNEVNIELRQRKSTANYQMGKSDGTWQTMTTAQQNALNSGLAAADKTKLDGMDAALALKQNNLNRTITSNDDSTTAVTDTGGNLSIPLPVTVVAPSASTTQISAGTRSLRAQLKYLIDNIAWLFNNVVKTTNDTQSIGGTKTFTTIPQIPTTTPTLAAQVVSKSYLDSLGFKKIAVYTSAQENTAITDSSTNTDWLCVVKEA